MIKEKLDEEVKTYKEKVREMVSQRFHKQLKVFEKTEPKRIPVRKSQDHVINLRENFIPRKERIYLISREEKEKVWEFVEKQLRKGYIKLLKLSQTSLVFFVGKKDRKKRIVQDYRYLKKKIIKNNYSLFLISNLINTMETKKIFIKINL